MGFFNKLRKQLRKSIRTGEAPVMPRRGGFLGGMPQTKPAINPVRPGTTPSPFGPRDFNPAVDPPFNPAVDPPFNLPRPIEKVYKVDPSRRKPRKGSSILDAIRRSEQKKFTGLSGLFRRLQEQIRNQQMPQPMQELRAGDIMTNAPVVDTRSFPRIPGPPAVAPDVIPNLNLGMPVMPEERMAPPVMNQMQGQPRMMMSRGRDANMVDFLNSDPQQQIFGIETRIGILENQLEEAKANNDRQAYDMIVDQINDADAQIIDIKNSINPLRTSGRPEMVGPRFDGFEEFITSIGPQNYGDYVGEPTLDDILSDLEKKN